MFGLHGDLSCYWDRRDMAVQAWIGCDRPGKVAHGTARRGRCGYEWWCMVMFVGTEQGGAGLERRVSTGRHMVMLGTLQRGRLGKVMFGLDLQGIALYGQARQARRDLYGHYGEVRVMFRLVEAGVESVKKRKE